MRVWILEDQPEYEATTRHGVFTSPVNAWNDLFALVEHSVFNGTSDDFRVYVGADQSANPDDVTRDILVMITYRSDDTITLSGSHVKGSEGGAPTLAEWRDLQQVAGLLRQHAVQSTDFVSADEVPNKLETGTWRFRREDY